MEELRCADCVASARPERRRQACFAAATVLILLPHCQVDYSL